VGILISPAYAQAAGDPASTFQSFIPLILIFVVFYFLLIRPQQKKAKDHKTVLDALRRGDRVVTAGGVVGLVTKVTEGDREVTVEIADGVRVKVIRDMIASVLSKTEPVAAKAEEAETK
jgi:preprotein translocase subunit YajC